MAHPLKHLSVFVVWLLLSASLVMGFGDTAYGTPSVCAKANWVSIIDVSSNNVHPIGWGKLLVAGVAGAYIKNSDGYHYINPYWAADTKAATKAGIPYGNYYFAQPKTTDPTLAANFFVKSGGASGQLPPALDLEVEGKSPAATAQWAVTWLNRVRYLTNRTPIIYTGAFQPWSSSLLFKGWTLWLPAYPLGYKKVTSVCTLPLPVLPAAWRGVGWSMWQYTSVARLPGTKNPNDVSVAVAAWFARWTGAGVQPPQPGINKIPTPLYTSGSYGVKVVAIQKVLITAGLLPAGSADGYFGRTTKIALEKWQKTIGVQADGEWSAATQTASSFYLSHGFTLTQATNMAAMGAVLKANQYKVVF